MSLDSSVYWIWLAEALGQGSKLAAKLVNMYGNAEEVYHTPESDIMAREELTAGERASLKRLLGSRTTEKAQEIVKVCEDLHIGIITPDMDEFPRSLRALSDMPLVLYYLGTLPDTRDRLLVSVVGTRKMTPYGRKISYSLGYGLGTGGALVVSGMALGADSMAMVGALDSGSPTIAVLGCGVDVIYPHEHKDLYRRTIEHGAVISEYPPGSAPSGHHFPVRNRIISGLSEATVVVEGNASSGALITARHAAAQGKKVFAVPGKVGDPESEGPLMLLQNNALPVYRASDILSEFEFLYPRTLNLDFLHTRLRDVDFEAESMTAMEKSRIGVRGVGNTYGSGINGGRANKNKGGDSPTTHISKEAEDPVSLGGKKDENRSKIKPLSGKKSKKTGKKRSRSEENSYFTTGFALSMLDENDWKVYNIMQQNVPVLPDSMVREDLTISDIMCALSTLELCGMVESTAGGLFTRVGENTPVTLVDETDG